MRKSLLLSLFCLAGCTVGPDYHQPDVKMPNEYASIEQNRAPLSQPVSQAVDLTRWWQQFHDPELESLIERALNANLDLLTAASRVREAREQEIVTGAAELPTVNAAGNTIQLHSGSNPLQSLTGAAPAGTPVHKGTNLHLYSAGFDATWELDIFGGTRRAIEAAKAGTEAAQWEMRDGEVTLTAEIGADYFTLRSDQARLALLRDQQQSQQGTLDLVAARARTGFVTELDVNQQRTLLASTIAEQPQLVAEIAAMRHAIAILSGLQPEALDTELNTAQPLPPVPPSLPVGLPSGLLRDRPDVREAERKLAQSTANVGVAVADLYPKFDLIAALSLAAPSIGALFNSSSLSEAGLGTITWPIFNAGKTEANIGAKTEEENQAYYAYQKAVLGAVGNAEDALTRYATDQQRVVALGQAVTTAANSTQLALQQYRAGFTNYTSVLQAQSQELTSRDTLVQAQGQLAGDLVSLFKALGGGWRDNVGAESAAPPFKRE
ncbi:MAG TPA: efflux transporter outer membrane subunit [Rhizomicrobium sp.]|nr:efflux transporter outer membrane subunit [Rhizomicrobium sp.]